MHDAHEELFAVARAAAVAHGLPGDSGLTLLNISENSTFRVDAEGHPRCTLRIHRAGYQSRAEIDSELTWIEALRAEGVVDTPACLPTPSGARVLSVPTSDGQARDVVRFAWVQGTEPAIDRLVGDFRVLGAMAARLHQQTRRWTPPRGFTRSSWTVRTSIGNQPRWGRWQEGLGVGPTERALLGRLAETIGRRLAALGTGPEVFGLVHADMRQANLIVDGDRISLIDFDDCGYSWYLYDLAAALSFIEHRPEVPELIASWLEGYRTVAEPKHETEITTLVLLRRLLLVAWVGSHRHTDTAQQLGTLFTEQTCDLAENYLREITTTPVRSLS